MYEKVVQIWTVNLKQSIQTLEQTNVETLGN